MIKKVRKSTDKFQHGQFYKFSWCKHFFLTDFPKWDEGQTSSMCFNLLEPLPIEMSLCVYENLLVLGAGLFEYMRTERMVSKYHIKICSKNNQEEE